MTSLNPATKITILHVTAERGLSMRDVDANLESYQSLVGGYIECLRLTPRIDCWLNEEGKLNGLHLTAIVLDHDGEPVDVIAGPFFLASHDDEGNTVGLDGETLPEAVAALRKHLVPLPRVETV